MKLIELKLKNIKTYVDEKIKFSDVINCSLGLNGAGKSSKIDTFTLCFFSILVIYLYYKAHQITYRSITGKRSSKGSADR